MYIITSGLNSLEDHICHYGRKGMKWGEHIFTGDDIKKLKQFVNRKESKETSKALRAGLDHQFRDQGMYDNGKNLIIKKGSKLGRYSSEKNETPRDSKYMFINDTPDDWKYENYAKQGMLGSKKKTQYKLSYEATKDLKVAKGKQIIDDVIKKYGDKDLKELYAVYNDLNMHENSEYVLAVNKKIPAVHTMGKIGSDEYSSANQIGLLQQEIQGKIDSILYHDMKVYDKVVDEYRKKGYDAIVDAEDQLIGLHAPLIVIDPDEKLVSAGKKKIQNMFGF